MINQEILNRLIAETQEEKQILENERTVFQKEINNLVKDYKPQDNTTPKYIPAGDWVLYVFVDIVDYVDNLVDGSLTCDNFFRFIFHKT